jgi:membrane-bound lytic murein transglycosylase D
MIKQSFLKGMSVKNIIFYFVVIFFVPAVCVSSPIGGFSDTLYIRGQAIPPLPDTLSFCGEFILTQDRDVRERLDEIFLSILNRQDRIVTVLKRTTAYFPFFEKTLREMSLPDDLKYLSVAESSLKLDAYSHADAAGLWQFIPSTGKIWGLTVGELIDERFHVEKSTRASLSMLKQFRNDFENWALAAAAYNAGPGYIRKILKQQLDSNYYQLYLNRETRNYLFHIIVIKEIIERPERYGFYVPESARYLPYDHQCKTVTVRGPVKELGKWIQQYGMNYKQLKVLNYWIMKDQLPEGEWTLLVPENISISDSIHKNGKQDTVLLSDQGNDSDSSLYYIFYTVQEGDRLSKIANQFQVSMKDVMRWNQLKSDVAMLDSKLKIYYPRAQAIRHEVKNGENLFRIAEKYQLSVYQIKKWNQLTDDQIHTGMNLLLNVPAE